MNLTKTVRKVPIDSQIQRVGHTTTEDEHKPGVKYDAEGHFVSGAASIGSDELS